MTCWQALDGTSGAGRRTWPLRRGGEGGGHRADAVGYIAAGAAGVAAAARAALVAGVAATAGVAAGVAAAAATAGVGAVDGGPLMFGVETNDRESAREFARSRWEFARDR